MPPPLFFRRPAVVLFWMVAMIGVAGCNRRTVTELSGPPDLMKDGKGDPRAQAMRIRVFHVNHIWAGEGFDSDGSDYRGKVSIWSYSQGEPPLGELYFHDADKFEPKGRHKNAEPGAGPHQIHFPISALGPILALMRSANEPVYLFYYRGKWAIGTSLAEAIGSE